MDNRADEENAKQRWITIQAVRLGGVFMTLLGLLTVNGVVGWGETIGYVLVALGLVEIFVIPAVLARRWSSRRP